MHRIVLDQQFKEEKIFQQVLDWAIHFAMANGWKYICMDTWADNAKLINHYKTHGFTFFKNYITSDTKPLPIQHPNLKVALLEYIVKNDT